jgi:hypothetical protein
LLRFLKVALVFELAAVVWLAFLMGQFFYRAYDTSSSEHLPVSFLAALVMLVLGTQQTAMSFRRERLRMATGLHTPLSQKLRRQVAFTTMVALICLASAVLLVILRNRLH